MGIRFEGLNELYAFIFIVIIGQGTEYINEKYMDSYTCPKYCKVDHDHDMEISGRFSATRELRYTRSGDDSLRILHMEAESVDSGRTP